MTNDEWKKYYDRIKKAHKEQFKKGGGGELKERKYPPKMASFGSSSRFVYELSRDIEGFSFEEKLDTKVGGFANLDGCFKRGLEYVYIEAKKREIYGASHKKESIKNVYLNVYKWIQDECKNFSFEYESDSHNNECSKVIFKINNDLVRFFDLKQLICHFLGITYDIAEHQIHKLNVRFLYLLYNPTEIEKNIDDKYRTRLLKRYTEVGKFIEHCIKNGTFNSIFQAVLSYQVENLKLSKPDITFTMKLVDQSNYKEEFK